MSGGGFSGKFDMRVTRPTGKKNTSVNSGWLLAINGSDVCVCVVGLVLPVWNLVWLVCQSDLDMSNNTSERKAA